MGSLKRNTVRYYKHNPQKQCPQWENYIVQTSCKFRLTGNLKFCNFRKGWKYFLKNTSKRGQSDSTSRELAFYLNWPDSYLSTPYGPLSPPLVIPDPWAEPGTSFETVHYGPTSPPQTKSENCYCCYF